MSKFRVSLAKLRRQVELNEMVCATHYGVVIGYLVSPDSVGKEVFEEMPLTCCCKLRINFGTHINEEPTMEKRSPMETRSVLIELTAAEWEWVEQCPNHRKWDLGDRVAFIIRCKMGKLPNFTETETYDAERSPDN